MAWVGKMNNIRKNNGTANWDRHLALDRLRVLG